MKHDHSLRGSTHYRHLAIMLALSFVSMFTLMYAMVNSFGNVFANANQVYMAALMMAPMAIIELAVMRAMYQNRRLNMIFLAAGLVVGLGSWILIRQQIGTSDRQFIRSMIPHHAGAILMCEQAPLQDPDLKQLCRNIITGQQAEIDLMKAKLSELTKGR
jgi:uncharacterized protein (DUF305 family)